MRIALTGNPNSGKTTMYNALTGRNEKVGNWAGVTVEKKEHPIKKAYCSGTEDLIAVDLPGAYSMSPFTSEESITSSYVKHEHPDAIINIVDATNLSRSLFFTTQLLELGIPVVVALNKSDINAKKQTTIDTAALSAKLGCPVVETVSTAAEGLKAVVDAAVAQSGKTQGAPYVQGDIDLTDKKVVEEADRKRFAFVNSLVSQVEPDYTIGLLTSYSMPDVGKQQLESCIAQYADDRNGDGQVKVVISNYVFSDSDTIDYQIQQASVVRFMGEASTNEAMIYLHDEVAFNSLEDSFDGFFQYNDGTAMPEDAKDYENAMVSWNDLKGFAEFVPQTTEEDSYDAEVLTELFGRLRVSVRAAEGSSIEKKEKDMEYHSASLALLERIRNDEKLNGETAVEEG